MTASFHFSRLMADLWMGLTGNGNLIWGKSIAGANFLSRRLDHISVVFFFLVTGFLIFQIQYGTLRWYVFYGFSKYLNWSIRPNSKGLHKYITKQIVEMMKIQC